MTDFNPEDKDKQEGAAPDLNPSTEQNMENTYSQQSETKTESPVQPQQEEPVYSGNQQQNNYQNQGNYQQQTYYQGQPNYSQQGSNYGSTPPNQNSPENNMTMSIVATVLGFLCCSSCCIGGILGVIAIVFSSQVNTKFMMGDTFGALNSAKTAKTLAIISLVITAVSLIGTIAYYAVIFATGGMDAFMDGYREALEQLNY